MDIIKMLLKEMDQEAVTTRKMLAVVPNDKYDWQPHPKSMTLSRLAAHVAELPGWIKMVLETSELDFASGDYQPTVINNTTDLLAYFEKNLAEGRASLASATETELEKLWTLRNGEQVYSVDTKAEVIRMSFCQIVHHRAQLGVFLRLLNVPIPGSYGPSADENVFETAEATA
ncbi:DinB family protein [Mucilaginibacter ginsenosidivorans]|uniref:DinB family protein n=1 Tax=Mucilaginibacter ginsenosidivorans TaxID=398053 RepID=A0A5B8UYB7_9SPHI|nr:DinB family protein [Mucilaginibacter ginsenosidivorans]QEC63396.1 DinB family protein [Mucilaginibacter ginsenosidivorans]